MRVRIKKIPSAAYGGQQPDGALDVTPAAWGGASTVNEANNKVKKTLSAVPRNQANLEAEGGETAFGPISGDTIPDHMIIKGPRHTNGGVPLNLPEDTFIFSDTKSMRIKDPKILKMFGKTRKKGGYTPAELAKPYDINKYKAILMDPDSDRKDRDNAELMIKNYVMKLGALAIAQESKKGFPQGIPEMARPYMEANGITEEDLMPEQEQMAQEGMPQGEMPEDGMVQYGGTPQYPHGGFHDPFGDLEKRMQENTNANITLSSAESVMGASDAKAGIFTADNPMTNPLTGQRQAFMTDSKTGDYVEVEQPEKSEDRTITFEQKINDAYDVDLNALADQGAAAAGFIGNFADGINKSKRMKSIIDRGMDKESKETVFSGLHYANTPGVVAPSGVSPTTVQSYRSQFGGELDRFVYGGEEPMAYGGSQELTYGGVPMSLYGMEMGGSYYPTMSTGGAARVRITALPRKDNGGDDNYNPSRKDARSVSKKEYDAATGDGWRIEKGPDGKEYKVFYRKNKEVNRQEMKVRNETLTDTDTNIGDLCTRMKRAVGAKNSLANYTAAQVLAANYPALDKNGAKYKELLLRLQKCENIEEGGKEQKDVIKYDPDETSDDKKMCKCPKIDEKGNILKDKETGEIIYEETLREREENGECPCDAEIETEFDYEQVPRWSDRAIGNLITQTRLRTDAERFDPVLMDRPEYSPTLQRRYDQDIQSNLAGLRRSIDTGGGTAQQKLFQNLAALDSATTQVGKRQKQTEDYNVNVLNQAAQIAANLQAGTDAKNQAYLDRARGVNLSQADKETAARNAKMQVINRAKTDAQQEMLQKATWNFNNPEFQIDYQTGMPYFDPNYKEPNPTKGQQDLVAVYQDILGKIGDTDKNKEIALNLARQKVYGTQKSQFGGYVSGNSMFPFFNE